MTKKSALTAAIILTFAGLSSAIAQNLLNGYYDCDNRQNCSGNCQASGLQGQYLVDKLANTVTVKVYQNGQPHNTVIYRDCTVIIDSENWDCSSVSSYKENNTGKMSFNKKRMINGVFFGEVWTRSWSIDGETDEELYMSSCAK